jgi:zinc protease
VLAAPPQVGPRALVVEKEAESTAISLGYPWMMRRGHPDYPALFLAMSAFGEHRQFNGRLMHDLRAVRGLNYGDYAYVEHFSQDGFGNFAMPNIGRSVQDFTMWIRPVENVNRVFALRAALWEAQRLATGGLTDEEVSRAKKFLAGYTVLFTQTDSRRLGYAMDERYYGTPGFLDGLRARIATLTTDEVNAAIRKWIHPAELRFAVVTKDGAGMAKALLDGVPSSIHYDSPKPPEVLADDKTIEKLPFGLTDKEVRVAPASALFEK